MTVDDTQTFNRIVILYGSQTGNAEDMAKRLGYQAKTLNYDVLVESMDDFPLPQLTKDNLVIFICSTTGHGQEPENMKNFYNFIRRKDLPSNCLKNLNFLVYGLGDSSYAKFNYVAKILYKRLINCGAQPIQDLVKGDEQHHLGCDGIIYPKLEEFWTKLDSTNRNLFSNLHQNPPKESSYKITIDSNLPEPNIIDFPFKETYQSKYKIKSAICTLNERVTAPDHFQDIRHIILKSLDHIDYEPGDVVVIHPENSLENVQLFINLLNLNPDDRISISKKDRNYMINYPYDYIPDGITIFDLVRRYLDIQSVPKRSFFEYLWQFSNNNLERNKLKEFATTEGQEEMYEYCIQPKRSILEVMADFPHTIKNIVFDFILDLIPPIKPRSFSIASSNKLHPNELHMLVGVVKYQTRLKKTRRGLCSTYLSKIPTTKLITNEDRATKGDIATRVPIRLVQSEFRLPPIVNNKLSPLIMIGPGTGLAPFRGFLQEIHHLKKKTGLETSDIVLYYGCRYKSKDYLCQDELAKFIADGILTKLRVAFSRDQSEKVYVTHLLKQNLEETWDIIHNRNGHIYICGEATSMAKDVMQVFKEIIMEKLEVDEKVSDDYLKKMELDKRYKADVWS